MFYMEGSGHVRRNVLVSPNKLLFSRSSSSASSSPLYVFFFVVGLSLLSHAVVISIPPHSFIGCTKLTPTSFKVVTSSKLLARVMW